MCHSKLFEVCMLSCLLIYTFEADSSLLKSSLLTLSITSRLRSRTRRVFIPTSNAWFSPTSNLRMVAPGLQHSEGVDSSPSSSSSWKPKREAHYHHERRQTTTGQREMRTGASRRNCVSNPGMSFVYFTCSTYDIIYSTEDKRSTNDETYFVVCTLGSRHILSLVGYVLLSHFIFISVIIFLG